MARTITIRNVPERVMRGLRDRARRNHRSMQKEVVSILEQQIVDRASMVKQLSALGARLKANMTIDEIHDAIDEGRP